ncbi:MAG: U32 family peptidase [Clostridiales bacterium]|nr:U32 family peptidase [Clostridiales bacterium]
MTKKIELLAPVGNLGKLNTALHFGADAVYLGGKEFGLRAFTHNFTQDEMERAIKLVHSQGKKVYVTVNIFAKNSDFGRLYEYLEKLYALKVDGVIVSDIGLVSFIRKHFPNLDVHISTQANTTNKYSAAFYASLGVKRIVLARELCLDEIKEIKDFVGDSLELEVFIHGAMCISYSGRCLLSNYLSSRDSNRGECVQACRWEYSISEVGRQDKPLTLQQDTAGSYILNSKDMNTISILDKIIETGVSSLKIEGRVKSEYYVGCVVSAYRKRIDDYFAGRSFDTKLIDELNKVSHREYTTGFYLGKEAEVNLETSKQHNDYVFCAQVIDYDSKLGCIIVEQRNRFYEGDELEVVSNQRVDKLVASEIYDQQGNRVNDCKLVQQILYIKSDIKLDKYDMLRKKRGNNAK